MQEYELCALFSGSQTEEDVDEISKIADNLLKEAQAEVKFRHSLGRKKLAYDIEDQAHGSYRVWLFEAEADKIQTLSEKLRLSKDVLRHIITKLERVSIEDKIKDLQEPKKERILEKEDTKPEPSSAIDETVQPDEKKESSSASTSSADKKATEDVPKEDEKKVSLDQLDEKLDELLESDKL